MASVTAQTLRLSAPHQSSVWVSPAVRLAEGASNHRVTVAFVTALRWLIVSRISRLDRPQRTIPGPPQAGVSA